MATPTRNTATPADESLLDMMAADHVSLMRRRVQEQATQGDAANRRLPAPEPAPEPEPAEAQDASSDEAATGSFHSEPDVQAHVPTPILVDLPAELFEEQVAPEAVEVEDVSYQAAPTEPPAILNEIMLAPISDPQPTASDRNLAEEILSLQMADEMQLETADMLDAEPIEESLETAVINDTQEQDDVVDSILPIEATLEELAQQDLQDEQEEEEEEDILLPSIPSLRQPRDEAPAPATVRPKPTITAIRPPAQPSRMRSLMVQVFIVLLSLTMVGMVAYLLGILKFLGK